MNSEINMKKWLLIIFVSITLISTSIAIVIHYDRKEKERQMTARFDKFMWYYYPYLENISKVSEIYKQMHISLMYDYLTYHRGRYIYESVPYQNGGVFSMKDYSSLEYTLLQTRAVYAERAFSVIDTGPYTRSYEIAAFFKILDTAEKLSLVEIYDSSIGFSITPEQKENEIDSLNMEIQRSLNKLSKYKSPNSERNLNMIRESEYDLSNY